MKLNKSALIIFTTISLTTTTLIACSSKPYTGEKVESTNLGDGITLTQTEDRRLLPGGKLAGGESAAIKMQANVDKIDYTARTLSIKSSDGKVNDFLVGPEVKNFNQIKVGDQVNVEAFTAVDFEVRKPTLEELELADTSIEIAAKASAGQMPAAGAVKGQLKIATVEAIDKDKQTVSLKGIDPNGSVTVVKAKYPQNLSKVKVGDTIVVTVTQSLIANIERL